MVPRRRRGPPTSPRPALGHGPGNPGWRRSEPTARICPMSDVRLGRWYAWGASEMSWAQPCIWHALGADCRRAIRVPSIDFGANSRGLGDGQHRNLLRASRATFAWGSSTYPKQMRDRSRSVATVTLCLGYTTDALRVSASPVGALITGPPDRFRDPSRDLPPEPPGRGSPRVRARVPPGGAPRPPAPGAPPGAPGRPRDAPGRPPVRGPVWARFRDYIYIILYYSGGIWAPAWGCTFVPPAGPPGGPPRGGAKKCTFFWVFNNSPSRDSLVPPRDTRGTVWDTGYGVIPGAIVYSTMRSMPSSGRIVREEG